jgi:hypothetical protein
MTSERDPSEATRIDFLCPECGQPVRSIVVHRRKVLGAWAPVWGPGACHNPQCPRSAAHEEPEGAEERAAHADPAPPTDEGEDTDEGAEPTESRPAP